MNNYKIYVDGASRGNPGPSAAGICIKKNNEIIYQNGFFLGQKTNNQAEYLALLIGIYQLLKFLKEEDKIDIISDSQLLVRQITGHYKVRHPDLKKIHAIVMSILEKLNYNIEHVLREYNKEADKQANLAIDKKLPIDAEFINFLKKYETILDI